MTTKPSKVIFLDFDGVLNYRKFLDGKGLRLAIDEEHFDPGCVGRLNQITRRTGAEIVLSTSWRILLPMPEITSLMARIGIEAPPIDVTPRSIGSDTREDEISNWIEQNLFTGKLVVLDDCVYRGTHRPQIRGRVVQTEFDPVGGQGGLRPDHVELAVRMLGEIEAADGVRG